MEDKPKKRGRPPKAPEERETEHVGFYLSPADKSKLKQLGGTKWLKAQIKKASIT